MLAPPLGAAKPPASAPGAALRLLAGLALLLGLGPLAPGGGPGRLSAQELPTLVNRLPAEAPSSLFSAASGQGELSALGSWQLSLLSSLSLSKPAGGGLQLGQAQPLLFTQSPDLLLNFSFLDRWYVEARVSPQAGDTRYAMGYRGGEGETLEELRLGNSGIGLPDLPFVSLGEGGAYSFGALLRAGSPSWQAAGLLRYDQADRVHRVFLGSRELSETTRAASDFVRGRWFLLPAAESGLRVYVESAVGPLAGSDGRSWRLLGADEYGLAEAGKELVLGQAATTRVAVGYAGLGLPLANPAQSSLLSIGGSPAALVFDPTAAPQGFNAQQSPDGPVEDLSRYALDPGNSEVFVRDRASGRQAAAYRVIPRSDGSVEVRPSADTGPDPRPFAGDEPSLYTQVPDAETWAFAELGEFELVVQSLSGGEGIPLEADAIPSSVEVSRDGIPDSAFEVDSTKHLLILLRPPSASERIEVSYLKESSERRSASLSAGLVGLYSREDLSAWAALTGHLGIPGQGFAQGGQDSPAWAELALGAASAGERLKTKLGLAGRLGLAESSGRYRIDGMEDQGEAASSYWPKAGTLPPGYSLANTAAPSFEAEWPQLSRLLHPDGSEEEALQIVVSSGSPAPDLHLLRVIDTPPLSSFGSFEFFVKRTGGTTGTRTIGISIDDGLGGHQALSLSVNLTELSAGWTRVRYDFAKARLYLQDGEGGAEVPSMTGTVTRNALVTSASRIVIDVSGLSAGDSLLIDELLLVDPSGSASLALSGSLSYADKDFKLAPVGFGLLQGFDAAASLSAGLAAESSASSDLHLATRFLFFDLDGGLGLSAYQGSLSLQPRHRVGFSAPGLPLSASDAFAPALGDAGYAKSDSLGLSLGPLGSLKAELSSVYAAGAGEAGLLSRSWGLSLGDGRFLAARAGADELSASPPSPSARATYGERWLESFSDYLPEALGQATRRDISGGLDLLSLFGSPLLSAKLGLDGNLAAPDRGEDLLLRAGGSFPLPGGLDLSPYYSRAWKARRPGPDADLLSFASSSYDSLKDLLLPWTAAPFAEFGSAATASAFAARALSGAYASASYTPSLGLDLRRDPGLTPWELLIPSSLGASYSRLLASDGLSVSDGSRLAGQAVFSGLELYGSKGAYPLFKRYANDEYRLGLAAYLEESAGGAPRAWGLTGEALVSLLGAELGRSDRLVLTQRYELKAQPSGLSWTLKGGLDLSRAASRSWLLSLYQLLADRGLGAAAKLPSGLDSLWLRALFAASPTARRVLSLDWSLAEQDGDDPYLFPALNLGEAYESRISLPRRLEAWSKLRCEEHLDRLGAFELDLEASLGLTLSF